MERIYQVEGVHEFMADDIRNLAEEKVRAAKPFEPAQ
jgi:hypothetical protein